MDITQVLIVLIIILVSMVLHELAHGVVAYWLGDDTAKEEGRLTLNPLAHLEPFTSVVLPLVLFLMHAPVFGGAKPVPINTSKLKWGVWGMALVGVAGPMMNLLIAFVAFLIGHFTGLLMGNGVTSFILVETILINSGFATFNLLPIPPLDGSRVLYAIAPDGARRVMEHLESTTGLAIVFVLVMVFGTALSRVTTGVTLAILDFFQFLVGG